MNTKLLLGLSSMILVGGAAFAFRSAQEGPRRGHPPVRAQQSAGQAPRAARGGEQRAHGGRAEPMRERLRHGRERLRALEISDEQRELARQAARELAPKANEVRPQIRALVERAKEMRRSGDAEGARAMLRNELKPLLESAKPHAERATAPLVRSLRPEQRAKLEAGAQRRGQNFDERRFSQRLGLMLGSRRAQQRAGCDDKQR
jgi:hypothetical protein